MASRLYKTGTVVTRTRDLLKCGVIKEPPLWLDVVESHPPLTNLKSNEPAQSGRPPFIRYQKDVLIRHFVNNYVKTKERLNLFEGHNELSTAEKFVQLQMDLLKDQELVEENIQKTSERTKEIFEKQYGIKLTKLINK